MTDPKTPEAEDSPKAETTPEKTTANASEDAAAAPVTTISSTPTHGHWWSGTGRRKAAVARVRIRPGSGTFLVNRRDCQDFFTEERDRANILGVLEHTKTAGSLDVRVTVRGGGYTGQAGAIILGLGRALHRYDSSLESILRGRGYLTRDPRRVERKKPGQPGARKRFQFSKR